jgi:hypothetical protein
MRESILVAVSVVAAITVAEPAVSHDTDREIKCEKIKQDIRTIQSKRRAGYTRAEGEKLKARLKKLRALRSKTCR